MRKRRNQLALLAILLVTGFSLAVTWPGNPDRYLPDFFPWPSGHGLNVGDFDRDEFRLGLDLAGGVSVTLEATGEAAPVRPGETLEEFALRRETSVEDLLGLNRSLRDLDPDTYTQPLPEEIRTLSLPLLIEGPVLDDAIAQARDIIEERVNGFGDVSILVCHSVIQRLQSKPHWLQAVN